MHSIRLPIQSLSAMCFNSLLISKMLSSDPCLYVFVMLLQELVICVERGFIIVNREEGLEAGVVSDNMLKFWSRDNTSALESRLVIRAVQKIKLSS